VKGSTTPLGAAGRHGTLNGCQDAETAARAVDRGRRDAVARPTLGEPAPASATGAGWTPADSTAWRALGVELIRSDRQAALAAFRRAIDLAPDDAASWRGLGLVFINLDRHDEAAGAFSRAAELAR
jgi:Flp pilus assembly protein TadD